jgi:hypothetical protein
MSAEVALSSSWRVVKSSPVSATNELAARTAGTSFPVALL